MAKSDIIRHLSEHFRQQNIIKMVVLTDENVEKHYSDYFSGLSECVSVDKIVLPAGEQAKSIDTAVQIWQYLADKQCDRNTFLLNFGGGTVSDLGGFVASTYKRGIRYANVPTTLLAMIDASIGGKTGINLHHLKNAVGSFYFPDLELPVDISFLETLPVEELRSGFGELVKNALIGSEELFDNLCRMESLSEIRTEFVDVCIHLKQEVIKSDPKDLGFRHILNFGHTFGHALESYAAKTGKPIAHGIAVAQGLYYESLLSTRLGHLPQEEWKQIAAFLKKNFVIMPITDEVFRELLFYMLNDKKNHDDMINFTLLDHIGHAIPDFQIPASEIQTHLSGVITTP